MKTINYKNIEWIVLEETEKYTKLLAKNGLSKEIIEDICEDERYYDDCMAHQNNLKYPYTWERSNIRKVLNDRFLNNYLDVNDLYLKDDDYVRLLTKEEVEELDDEVRKCNDWYWTMTPYGDSASYVWFVNSNGYLYNSYGDYGGAGVVRPVIYLTSNTLEKDKAIEPIKPYYDEELEEHIAETNGKK